MRLPFIYIPVAALILVLMPLSISGPADSHIIYLPLLECGEGTVEETATVTPEETTTTTPEETATATPEETTTATPEETTTATPEETTTATPEETTTVTPGPTASLTATVTATITPTSTATPINGENIQCRQEGNAEICAWVADADPPQHSIVTVYGRYLVDGSGVPSKHMLSVWHFETGTSGCDSGFTGLNGVAHCSRGIGSARAGYQVNVDVTIDGYTITTSFTPR